MEGQVILLGPFHAGPPDQVKPLAVVTHEPAAVGVHDDDLGFPDCVKSSVKSMSRKMNDRLSK